MEGKKARIFMVDDDTDLVDIVRSVLESAGYEFLSASSATEALDQLDSVNPDLIILDVMMEDLVAGFRVVNHLRNFDQYPQNRRYEQVPILMMTSIQQQTRMKFSQDAGSRLLPIDAFLEKPVKPRVLLEKIAELLRR
ncbi:MAG TPA: response regulator [Myxococcota bacterium]|mgnify:FL=1|nr:response regulator [Myxococcota bacterium]HQK50072.1 response regulator [Myxococcota bacterium]